MNRESYTYENHEKDLLVYAFESIGKQGTIKKMVYFQEISPSFYNLAMGDYLGENDIPIDDMRVSDNGDMPKVFATIAKIIAHFLHENPPYTVFIEGNTPIKKALYQRIITNNRKDLIAIFDLFGVDSLGKAQNFDTTVPYEALLIKAKPIF